MKRARVAIPWPPALGLWSLASKILVGGVTKNLLCDPNLITEANNMITKLQESTDNVLGFKLSGKLHDVDYQHFVPAVESAVQQHGKVRLFALFEDFHGWDAHALWDDIKFAARHGSDVDRIAMVGEKNWEKWMANVCKPFTHATIRYFDRAELDAAWDWVRQPT